MILRGEKILPSVVLKKFQDTIYAESGLGSVMDFKKIVSYSKIGILSLGFISAIIYSGHNLVQSSQSLKTLSLSENGFHTCFQRVGQTYTAKIIQDQKSLYLTQNFMSLTEECLAEGIVSTEDIHQNGYENIQKKLSTLASSVHWFHEDLLNEKSRNLVDPKILRVSFSDRFLKIESQKDDLFEVFESIKKSIHESINRNRAIFFTATFLMLVLSIFQALKNIKFRLDNAFKEEEARSEILDYSTINIPKSMEILKVALESNKLFYCSKLFTKFTEEITLSELKQNDFRVNALLGGKALTDSKYDADFEKKLDEVWENSDNAPSVEGRALNASQYTDAKIKSLETKNLLTAGKSYKELMANDKFRKHGDVQKAVVKNLEKSKYSVNLESILEKVIELLSDKIFKSRIQLDLVVDPNLNVYFSAEELEQVLFHCLSNSIQSLELSDLGDDVSKKRKLTITGIKLGQSIVLDIVNSGRGQIGSMASQLNPGDSEELLNIGLTISETFMKEYEGRLVLDQYYAKNGQAEGELVKLVFKTAYARMEKDQRMQIEI